MPPQATTPRRVLRLRASGHRAYAHLALEHPVPNSNMEKELYLDGHVPNSNFENELNLDGHIRNANLKNEFDLNGHVPNSNLKRELDWTDMFRTRDSYKRQSQNLCPSRLDTAHSKFEFGKGAGFGWNRSKLKIRMKYRPRIYAFLALKGRIIDSNLEKELEFRTSTRVSNKIQSESICPSRPRTPGSKFKY